MNRQRLALVLTSLSLCGSFGLGMRATAQPNPAPARLNAGQVAALVQAFYDQTTTFGAAFEQEQYTKVYDRRQSSRGRVTFKKPGKMRFDYAQPNGQVFVSDGQQLFVYQPPEEGERQGQLIQREMANDQLPQAFSFLTGTGRLDRDFNFRLLDARRNGFPNGYVLALRPRRPSAHYEQLLFFIRIVNRGEQRAGIVQRVLIIDAQGNTNRFTFSDMQFNRQVPDARFRFTPPPNTRRVTP